MALEVGTLAYNARLNVRQVSKLADTKDFLLTYNARLNVRQVSKLADTTVKLTEFSINLTINPM